ncbi:phage terminase small subunit [Roseovarius sp. MBR-51]
MPNHKTPLAKARLTGADKANPQRYRDRSEPATSGDPVGAPPTYLSKDGKEVWREAAGIMSWLVREDRLALEIAAQAVAAIRETAKASDAVKAAQLTAARQALASLGATPADRSKIHIPGDGDEHDPFAQFDA